MWRLYVVLALCGASLVHGEQHGVSCNNITTLQNVSLTELQGSWVAQTSLDEEGFEVGFVCSTYEISDSRMIMKFLPGGNEEIIRLTAIGDNKGKFSVKTDQNTLQEQAMEFVVISSEPSSYLVMALCRPSLEVEGPQASNTTTELFVTSVFFLARIQEPGESGNISNENLAKIIDKTMQDLGLQNFHKKIYKH